MEEPYRSVLLVYGPLGLLAIIGLVATITLYRRQETRDAEHRKETTKLVTDHEAAMTKIVADHASTMARIAVDHRTEMVKIVSDHRTEITKMVLDHRGEMTSMVERVVEASDRIVEATQSQAKELHGAVDRTLNLAESMSRKFTQGNP